jgi:adenylyl- and sulfurtransferase ThiI
MSSPRTTILRWTGKGNPDVLQSSVAYVLGVEGVKAHVSKLGDSVTIVGAEPLRLAALFGNMPGVSWVAVGLTTRSLRELSVAAGELARRYLRKRDRFFVEAEGTAGVLASDISGIVTSAVLDAAKGARVSNESPRVRFRAAFDGEKGVAGVEVRRGPGGAPTGREQVACFVSGGIHSSVVAWEAVLQGFKVRLLHAKYSEESLRAVARLYSELSYRADPRGLSLEVVEGESVSGALSRYAASFRGKVFAGHTPETPGRQLPKVLSPLYLMSEEKFASEFEALGIKSFDAPEDWDREMEGKRLVRRFTGRRADVSGVLDGMR